MHKGKDFIKDFNKFGNFYLHIVSSLEMNCTDSLLTSSFHFPDNGLTKLIKDCQLELIRVTDGLGVIDPEHIFSFFEFLCRRKLCFGQPELPIVDYVVFFKHP